MRRHTQWKQQSSPGGSQGRERFLAPGTPCLTRPEPQVGPPGAGLVPPERGWSPRERGSCPRSGAGRGGHRESVRSAPAPAPRPPARGHSTGIELHPAINI